MGQSRRCRWSPSGWFLVRLATRPNGSIGWVRQTDVTVAETPYWISVDLATRHVALFRLDQQILSAPAGVIKMTTAVA